MNKFTSIESIYKYYYKDIYRYIYSLCRNTSWTEDIVQETFYRSYDHLNDLDKERVKPWLFRVAYNTFVDMYRKEKRHREHVHTMELSFKRSAMDEVLVKERIDEWMLLTEELTTSQRNILQLRDYHDFTYDEISKLTGLTLANVKVQLFRARKAMNTKLKGDENNEM